MKKRICIIGAGPSGLAQLWAFHKAKTKGREIPDIVCYEKQEKVGGLWNYNWRTGVDEAGNTCHGSMYRYLWSNGPKEGLGFADYTFKEHFRKSIPSFPPREVLLDYVEGRLKKTEMADTIKFNTVVRDVKFLTQKCKFSVISRNEKSDTETTEFFDNVIVASGHFSTPNAPYYEGFEKFSGRILHAHDFRDAQEFIDQDILILGSSYSAEDIGSQCWKYGCKSITVSHRTFPIGFNWPENWREVPGLVRVDNKNAYFKNGLSAAVDTIILCTGYKHHFPFLPDELRLKTVNRLAVSDLYKGVVWNKNTKLFYLGMQDQWYTFTMFDAQAWYVRDIILGDISLPVQSKLERDVLERQTIEDALKDDYECIACQGSYTAELINETDYPTVDVEAINQVFYRWKNDKKNGIMTFRDQGGFTSPIDKTVSPSHRKPWSEEFDDSKDSYLK